MDNLLSRTRIFDDKRGLWTTKDLGKMEIVSIDMWLYEVCDHMCDSR